MLHLLSLDPATLAIVIAATTDLPVWANYGILGVIVIALVVTKQLVPGWIYSQSAADNRALKDENARLVEKLLTQSETTIPALRESTAALREAATMASQSAEEIRLIRSRRR